MYVCLSLSIYIYIFLFGNTWLIAWHVSYLDYMGGPYESGSHCNQCKDLPTFSTVFFCCLHYCITVIYYVLFCLINYFQVQVSSSCWPHELCYLGHRFQQWSLLATLVISHYNDATWGLMRLISPTIWLFVQRLSQANNKGTIKALYYWPFVRRIQDKWWILHAKGRVIRKMFHVKTWR